MTEAASPPEGSEARADLIRRAEELLDAKRELVDGLRPFRDCIKESLERYGYTADAGSAAGGGLPRRLILGGIGIFAVAMVGLVFVFSGGGGDGNEAGGTAGDSGSVSSPSSSGSSADGSSAGGAVATVQTDVCKAAQRREVLLQFSSPDIQPTIPQTYAFQPFVDDFEFLTPPFEWSAVPPETTEIAILVLSLTAERAAEYMQDPELWWNQLPIGSERWVLTGLDPSLTSLPSTSRASPPSAGSVEHDLTGQTRELDGVDVSNKFEGPGMPGEYQIFSVFAMCDRSDPQPGEVRRTKTGELQGDSIAIGWFIAEAAW